MLTVAKLALAVFSFLSLVGKALFGWAIYRAGESAQVSKDTAATLDTVTRERDALVTAGTAEEAAKRHGF